METDALRDDLLSDDLVSDPYPALARLRAADPVRWNPQFRAWVVTRYDDVAAALRDPRLSSDRVTPSVSFRTATGDGARALRVLSDWLVFKDPPDHGRLRRLVNRAFTPRAVDAVRDRVEQVTDELIEALDVGDRGQVDLIRDVAYPLPAIVIAELLGVPPADRDVFKGWSDQLSSLVFGATGDDDRLERAQVGMLELVGYLGELLERRRAHPDSDLVSGLAAAQEGDDALTNDEVLATCALLLFGGHETTTNLIGNGVLALLRAPDQLARWRADPGLDRSAVEELLRYDGPAKVIVRVVGADLEIDGRVLRTGERVLLVVASANRDERRFTDPDRLDLSREQAPGLGFGAGIHYCLGAPLARMEAAIVIPRLLRRLDGLQLADRDPPWHPMLLNRGLRRLPLRFSRARPRAAA